jgi:hypothetical protein
MKHIFFFIFIFAATNLLSQTFYKIEHNDDKTGKFKQFPCYIEIDTAQIKDPKTVKVEYNGKQIEPAGNRFYLSTIPFTEGTNLKISRTDHDSRPIDKQKIKEHFANNHAHDKGSFYEIRVDRDSVYVGTDYKAVVEIDKSKVEDLSNITVLFYDVPLERKDNKFFIQYAPMKPFESSYELTIINKENNQAPLKITKYVYGMLPTSKR